MQRFSRQLKRKERRAACPFCEAEIPRPAQIETIGDCLGGRCNCGAFFICDLMGKAGGQAVVDGLALLCDGDIDRAMELQPDVDYQLERVGYRPRTHSIEEHMPNRGGAFGVPKLWFFRLLRSSG